MSDKRIEIDRSQGAGYIIRAPDGTFRRVTLADAWAAPALARVAIDIENTDRAAIEIFCWLAYPGLSNKDEKRRIRAWEVLAAWHWRSANHFDLVRKKDMPNFAKAIRADRLPGLVNKTIGRVQTRLTASQMLMWLAFSAGGLNATVGGRRPTAKWLSKNIARPHGKTQAEDARKRVWLHSRPVLHVADALRIVMSNISLSGYKGDMWSRLLCVTDWVPDLLESAEGKRLTGLPTTSVPPEHTIQFRPLGQGCGKN